MTTILDPDCTFVSLADSIGLDVRLKKAVMRLGHIRPTLVQSKCLPLALNSGRDLLVRAKTGSGKTLAYLLPLLQKVLQRSQNHNDAAAADAVNAVIMVPTRELCSQVAETVKVLTYYCDDIIHAAVLSVGKARGEKSRQEFERQEAMLRDRPKVVVGTPNGLLTHIRSGALDLKAVETVVVDEADLVLSFGYSTDIAEIMKALPRIYQGFLMSATLSPELDSLKKVVLHSPVILKLEQEEVTNNRNGKAPLKQFYIALPKEDKNLVIYVFLKLGLLKGKGLFFVNTTDAGFRLKLFLEQFHIRSSVLNAELPLRSRLNIIEQFNLGNFDYLIATDDSADAGKEATKAADESDDEEEDKQSDVKAKRRTKDSEYGVSRGLDFRNVSFVFNVDFPPNPKSYAHRVGRTARGGARGVALSLVDSKSDEQLQTLRAIQKEQPTIQAGAVFTDHLQGKLVGLGAIQNEAQLQDLPQPVLLDFDLAQVEGFRYRVQDVSRAVTRNAVREARATELKMEILNSERLDKHFEENPADLQLLRHDRLATNATRVQEHLKHVPKYLLPRGMQVATLNRKRKKKHSLKGTGGQRRSDNDPLQSFQGDTTLDGVEGDDTEDLLTAEFMDDGDDEGGAVGSKKQKTESKVFANTKDGTGHSTAGRNSWKKKHGKGQFSQKKRKTERKKEALGI